MSVIRAITPMTPTAITAQVQLTVGSALSSRRRRIRSRALPRLGEGIGDSSAGTIVLYQWSLRPGSLNGGLFQLLLDGFVQRFGFQVAQSITGTPESFSQLGCQTLVKGRVLHI